MATKSGAREEYFPAIESKYGQPMKFWFAVMADLADEKYPVQIAYLRENYGFSQAHANALVMYSRGSKSSKRFETPAAYFASIDAKQAKKIKAILKVITTKFPNLELVIAWNKPMLKSGDDYVFGADAATAHLIIAPWGDVLEDFRDRFEKLEGVRVSKKTIALPSDWEIETALLQSMVRARLKELK